MLLPLLDLPLQQQWALIVEILPMALLEIGSLAQLLYLLDLVVIMLVYCPGVYAH